MTPMCPPTPLASDSTASVRISSKVIRAATRNGALAAKLLHEIGTIECGKRADVVVLDADPLIDILNVKRIHAVIRDGVLLERSDLDQFK